MAMKGAKRVVQAEETAKKMAQALEWRKQGWSLWAIGQAMDPPCSGPYVSNLLKKALKQIIQEPVEDLVKIECERLDDMFIKQFEKAKKGSVLALEASLKIMERRAKLLGLDKPVKTAATDPTGEKEAENIPAVQVYIPDNGRDPQ